MPTDFEELKRKLLQSDEEYRQLATQHHDLDERIHDLTARHYLSEPEQLEEVTLKKLKLQLKDQMESICAGTATAAGPPRRARLTVRLVRTHLRGPDFRGRSSLHRAPLWPFVLSPPSGLAFPP